MKNLKITVSNESGTSTTKITDTLSNVIAFVKQKEYPTSYEVTISERILDNDGKIINIKKLMTM